MVGRVARARASVLPLGARGQLKRGAAGCRGGQSGICDTQGLVKGKAGGERRPKHSNAALNFYSLLTSGVLGCFTKRKSLTLAIFRDRNNPSLL